MIELDDFLIANPGARTHGTIRATRFTGFSFDSRIVKPGELFLAVRTDRGDGHDHLEAAERGGAGGLVCETAPADPSVTCVVVSDTRLAAYQWAAAAVRAAGVPVVGITGSAGKTTVKELTAHVLSGAYRVFRNPGNYSGAYGLPIALGGLRPDHQVAVLEMAVDHFGEMSRLVDLAPPSVGIVTVVAPAHLEAFVDLEGVAREKSGLVAALPPDGLAVLNADDSRVAAMAAVSRAPVVCYGLGPGADYWASDIRLDRGGTQFTLHGPDVERLIHLPHIGRHFVLAALAAVAAGRHFRLPWDDIARRLANAPVMPGRLRPIRGRSGSLILDDSYNASPEAVLAGLDVLGALAAGRRVAVLGEMAELGESAVSAHHTIGRRAADVADVVVTRGKAGEAIAEAARRAGMAPDAVRVTYTADDAVSAVERELSPDTIVLVKGSAVARMEQVVAGLMAEPEKAADELVRQDAAWRQLVVMRPDRPTWLEVDLGAVAANVRSLVEIAAPAVVMAVLKADAYGHGAVQVAHTVLRHGASWCGVACLSEAVALRDAGIDAPVLVLGYTPAWQARDAVRSGVRVAVFDIETARALGAAALGLGAVARVHVKVDSGMHRLGLPVEEVAVFLRELVAIDGLDVEGVFTHFAEADDPSGPARDATTGQLKRFTDLVRNLEGVGLRPPVVHAANSAALLNMPEARFDLVRPGIALYGLAPSAAVCPDWLRPAMAWKTQVAQVRTLVRGESLGYGRAWTAQRESVVATLPVGYADGFRRGPSSWKHVLVRGVVAPVVGRVSMDQAAADITDIPGVRQGDEVVLIGRQGQAVISAEDVGAWLGTLNYEVVSAILARVPRLP